MLLRVFCLAVFRAVICLLAFRAAQVRFFTAFGTIRHGDGTAALQMQSLKVRCLYLVRRKQ
jgi:hypothetical protein